MQEEVVDIEDMTNGISIMDLGLNEFRLDLLEYMKQHGDIETAPKGLHTVVGQTEDAPAGVIFVLRNINDSVNIDDRNRIHPFYMVYIGVDGEIVCDYLNPKKLLDTMRLLCRGKSEPVMELCRAFNEETDDGRNMGAVSELLSEAINSIIFVKAVCAYMFGNEEPKFADRTIQGYFNLCKRKMDLSKKRRRAAAWVERGRRTQTHRP